MTTKTFCLRTAGWIGAALLLFAARCQLVGDAGLNAAEPERVAPHHQSGRACPSCQKHHHAKGAGGSAPLHPCVRAGDPHRIAWYAKPSRNKRDTLGYVGGGAAWRGEPRLPDEGTWGLDYAGLFSRHHIWLDWLHGWPSRQTGGSYTTDGPHLLSH